MSSPRKRKCLACGMLFVPDPRNRKRQRFCSNSQCQKESHKYSQRRWARGKGAGYFRTPAFYKRLKDNRLANPKPKAPPHPRVRLRDKDSLLPQVLANKELSPNLTKGSLQDPCLAIPPEKNSSPTSSIPVNPTNAGNQALDGLAERLQPQQHQGVSGNQDPIILPAVSRLTPENFRCMPLGDKDSLTSTSLDFSWWTGLLSMLCHTTDKDIIARFSRQVKRRGLEVLGGSPSFSDPVKGEAHAQAADRT